MFKSKLIKSENYYKLRSKQLILMLLPGIPMGLIVNFYQVPIWLTIAMIGIYILIIVLTFRNQKRINSVLGNELIEIDEKELRIISNKGIREQVFSLDKVDKLILKNEYSMPQETMKDLGKEIAGNAKQNYLILQQNGQDRRIDFEIDSYFMLRQLEKLIENWESKGYNIARVNHS
jgi:cbb3-type cytochrome oxidase subunit 3